MLKRYSSQLLYFSVAIVFFLTFATVYGVYGEGFPMARSLSFAKNDVKTTKPTIKPDTLIKKEIRYLCGDKVSTKIPTTSQLIGLDFKNFAVKYPPEQGWNIDDSIKNTLTVVRVEQRVCPYHQDFRHLGLADGYLAIYEGPLGYNQKILLREDITQSSLPPEMQADLNMAMDYNNQSSDIQGRLKTAFEFETESQLNSVLENFDELRE